MLKNLLSIVLFATILSAKAQTPVYEYLFNNSIQSTGTQNGAATALSLYNSSGTVTYVQGRNGLASGAVRIPANNYLVANLTALPTGSTSRTFTFWVKHNAAYDNSNYYFSHGSAADGQNLSVLTGNSTSITPIQTSLIATSTLLQNAGTAVTSSIPAPGGSVWIHYAVVYNGTQLSMYRNGRLLATNALAINTVGTSFAINGTVASAASGSFVSMDYDEFRVYNSALTAEQVYTNFAGTTAPIPAAVYKYQFNNNLTDTTGANAFTGLATFTTGRSGFANTAVKLTNNALTTTLTNLPVGTNARTISMWVKFPNDFTTANRTLFMYGGTTNGSTFGLTERIINTNQTRTLTANSLNSDLNLYHEPAISTDNWIHYAIVYTNGCPQIYRNGRFLGSGSELNWNTATSDFYLGSLADGITNLSQAAYDDLEIYNTALNPYQIDSLFTKTSVVPSNAMVAPIQEFNFNNNLTNVDGNITLSGTSVTYTTPRPNGSGNAAKIAYTNNINGTISNIPTGNSTRTYAFWMRYFNSGIAPGFTNILQTGNDNNATSGLDLVYNGSGANSFKISSNSSAFYQNSIPSGYSGIGIPNDVWHHVALTYDTDQRIRLYLNGVLLSTSNVYTLNTIGSSISFGLVDGAAAAGFDIDDLKIYNRALSLSQIEMLAAISPSITTVSSSNVTATGATINYTANAGNANTTTVVRYGTSSSNLSLTVNGSNLTGGINTNASSNLSGLSPFTQYFYRVDATNLVGTVTSTVGNFTTLSTTPNIGAVIVNPITDKSGTINYSVTTTQQAATIAIRYGTAQPFNSTSIVTVFATMPANTTQNFNHLLDNLLPNTQYFFQIEITEANNTVTASIVRNFTTLAATSAKPYLTDIVSGNLMGTSATISFKVFTSSALATNTLVRYGTNANNLNLTTNGTAVNAAGITNSSIQLTGLNSNTTYYYAVEATNSAGSATMAIPYSFTTPVAVPFSAPTNDLVAYYSFNQNINSHRANGLHNLSRLSAGNPTYVTGKYGQAVAFSATTSSGLYASTIGTEYDEASAFTYCFWSTRDASAMPSGVNLPSFFEAYETQYLRQQRATDNFGMFRFGYQPTPPNQNFWQESAYLTSAQNNTWQHIALVHRPGSISDPNRRNFELYIDGVFVGNTNNGGPSYSINRLTNLFVIGCGTSNGVEATTKRFNGQIDEFYIYKRALSVAEINTVMNNNYNVPLPSTINSFTGAIVQNKAQLNWETTQEKNTSHFVVEYSTDGANFTAQQTVIAAGNSIATNRYSAQHTISNTTNHYYRLKVVDKDGRFVYSNVIKLQTTKKEQLFQVYPTITKSNITLQMQANAPTKATIQVMDLLGKTHITKNLALQAGTQSIELNLQQLAAGTYIVHMQQNNQQQTTTIIKQ